MTARPHAGSLVAHFSFEDIPPALVGKRVQPRCQRLRPDRTIVGGKKKVALAVCATEIEGQTVIVDHALDLIEVPRDISPGLGDLQDHTQRQLPVLAMPRVAPEFRILYSHTTIMRRKDLMFGKQYLTKTLLK
jgi:hypothetical protein